MAKRSSKGTRAIHKFIEIGQNARSRYVYFICKRDDLDQPGHFWEFLGPDDRKICESLTFRNKKDCPKSLRANQRHASTTQVRDDARWKELRYIRSESRTKLVAHIARLLVDEGGAVRCS